MFLKKYLLCILLLSYFHTCLTQEQPVSQHPVRAVMLAAGKSTRFKTKKSKLLFPICGRAMVLHPLKVLDVLAIPITLVLGYQAADVQATVTTAGIKQVTCTLQEQQLGTGHAAACAQHTWHDAQNIIILNGDMPLVNRETIQMLINEHINNNATLTFTTCTLNDPQRYGRITNTNGLYEIVEAKDCTSEQLKVTTINAGIYVVNQQWLSENINRLVPSKVTGELYLTDIVKMAGLQGKKVQAISIPFHIMQGVNTLQELEEVTHSKNTELIHEWMNRGVRFEQPESIGIDVDVTIAPDSIIRTGVQLRGKTIIGNNTTIDAYSIIQDATIGDNCTIGAHTVITQRTIASNTTIAPLSYVH